jgi:hypothetical protein
MESSATLWLGCVENNPYGMCCLDAPFRSNTPSLRMGPSKQVEKKQQIKSGGHVRSRDEIKAMKKNVHPVWMSGGTFVWSKVG